MSLTSPVLPLQLFDPASSTYTYILFDAATREALIIDPVDAHLERDLAVLREQGLTLLWAVETHAHADHITSAGLLAEHTGAKKAVPQGCGIDAAAVQLAHGDVLTFGREQLDVLHTPGHTAGSMSFVWRNRGQVFTGDTLLINGCGRSDFQSGSAQALYDSITQRLFALPDDTLVWPGHDYQGRTHSHIGAEKATNVRIAGKTLAEFVSTMNNLNLPQPKRMAEAVPANQNSGLRHDAQQCAHADPSPAAGYAGDVSPQLACQWWQSGEAVLIDVRTDAEREWVGFVPGAVSLAWKQWPGMAMNAGFDEGLKAALQGDNEGKKAVLLCRSGVRSIAAAKRATELGIAAYNILEGFEGDADTSAHRGLKGGWRFHGLPWRQA
jgi:sulfur dioxygenase